MSRLEAVSQPSGRSPAGTAASGMTFTQTQTAATIGRTIRSASPSPVQGRCTHRRTGVHPSCCKPAPLAQIGLDLALLRLIRWASAQQPYQTQCARLPARCRHRLLHCSAQPDRRSQSEAARDRRDQSAGQATSSTPRIGADDDQQPQRAVHHSAQKSGNGANSDGGWLDPGERNGGASAAPDGSSDADGTLLTSAEAPQSAQASSSGSSSSQAGSATGSSTGAALAEAGDVGTDGAAAGVEAEVDAGAAGDMAVQLGKSGWDGLPARYKMVVANSVAFMICNMVRSQSWIHARSWARTIARAAVAMRLLHLRTPAGPKTSA